MTYKQLMAASSILLLLTYIGCMMSDPEQSRDVILILFWTVVYAGLGAVVVTASVALLVALAVCCLRPTAVSPERLAAIERRVAALQDEAARQARADATPARAAVRPADREATAF